VPRRDDSRHGDCRVGFMAVLMPLRGSHWSGGWNGALLGMIECNRGKLDSIYAAEFTQCDPGDRLLWMAAISALTYRWTASTSM
jgi:hypothetical protein